MCDCVLLKEKNSPKFNESYPNMRLNFYVKALINLLSFVIIYLSIEARNHCNNKNP